ncbi:MAG: alpha/beta fold hydrolase [Solirubrobacterales bacterium]
MSRWLKVTLAVLAGIVVLLVLNAITVSNETKDAEVTTDGAELVDTSTGTLQVLDEGDPQSPPIVLIHGYAGSMRWYDQLAGLLGRDHRVIRIDLLGHGGSEKPDAGYAITDQASALAEALASLGVTHATVVGHSLGATVATALAEQSPELGSKVVNIDQAPSDDYENDLGFGADLAYVPVIGQALNRSLDVVPTSTVRGQFDVVFADGFNSARGFEDPDQIVEDVSAMTYSAFVDTVDAEGDFTDERPLDERLGSLEIPVLVIFGSEDQLYDAAVSIEPYEDIPGVRTEVIAGAGHSPNVEAPDQIAPLISAFALEPAPGEGKRDGGKKDGAKKSGGGDKGDRKRERAN